MIDLDLADVWVGVCSFYLERSLSIVVGFPMLFPCNRWCLLWDPPLTRPMILTLTVISLDCTNVTSLDLSSYPATSSTTSTAPLFPMLLSPQFPFLPHGHIPHQPIPHPILARAEPAGQKALNTHLSIIFLPETRSKEKKVGWSGYVSSA